MAITQDWFSKTAPIEVAGSEARTRRANDSSSASAVAVPDAAYKEVLDRVFAALGLILLLPLMAILCVLIKLTSRGPAFHLQERVGMHGKVFHIIKLRSMVQDAERATGPVWASENDPRITWIGRFLRKSHLDEMPQLVNVLLGQMSLVGPRPERPVFVDKFKDLIPGYSRRLEIKPGITGLAQVYHSYDATIHDVRTKLAYDILYMRTMCLKSDLLIVLQTVRRLTGRGAR